MNTKKTILLYSKNKNNIKNIENILEGENYRFQSGETIEDLVLPAEDIALLIIDTTSVKELAPAWLRELINSFSKPGIFKILIIKTLQIDSVIENEIEFDDFILYSQLEEELASRIKLAISKKKIPIPKNSIVINNLILNLDKYELSVNQKPIELTFKEFELFKILLQHQDKVFSRNKLLSAVWDYDFYGGSRTVDVHIRRLRSKIPPPYNLMLKTIRNVGYMFSTQIQSHVK